MSRCSTRRWAISTTLSRILLKPLEFVLALQVRTTTSGTPNSCAGRDKRPVPPSSAPSRLTRPTPTPTEVSEPCCTGMDDWRTRFEPTAGRWNWRRVTSRRTTIWPWSSRHRVNSPKPFPSTEEVLRLDARYPDAHYGLALVLKSQGDMAGAVQHYRGALQSVPNWPEVLVDLAWLLATTDDPAVRNPQEAVELAERAVSAATPPSWAALDASAAALASAGRVREAADRARRALESAIAAGNDAAASQIRERLRSYDR